MKITSVEALQLRAVGPWDGAPRDEGDDVLIVRIRTDEGLVGYGAIDSNARIARAVIDAPHSSHAISCGLASLLVGEDPTDVDRLSARMYAGSTYYGRRGVAVHALSGLEIALWDLAGKAAGQPVHALLGDQRRTRIKAYASAVMPDEPGRVAELGAALRAQGFGAVKFGWGPLGTDADRDLELVAAARTGIGPELDLMIDIGLGWHDPVHAARQIHRMERFNPLWIEEPFRPDDYAGYAALAAATDVPIAAGEEEAMVDDFDRLITAGDVAIVQPDVTRAGGLRECMRIAELARARGRRCIPHSWGTPITTAATLQLLAVTDEAEYLEYPVPATQLDRDLVPESPALTDGFVDVPRAPGLGISVDEDAVEHYRVRSG